MKEKKQRKPRVAPYNEDGQARDDTSSNYIKAGQEEQNPASDRVAKTARKGAGEQQNSSSGPINA